MKKVLSGLSLLVLCSGAFAQAGLQNLVIEKYYVSNLNDSIVSAAQGGGNLPTGSVTWRFYADMLPGYKLQAVYGVDQAPVGVVSAGDHELRLQTTTAFFNNEDYGAATPAFSKTNAAKNSVMVDSWFTVGAACNGNFGVLKTEDNGVANVVNQNGMLANNNPTAGIPLTTQDGFLAGTVQSVTRVPATLGDIELGSVSNAASVFSTYNGSFASLSGSLGPDTTNKVLFAQITTNGTLTYKFNIQVGTPGGGIQRFVHSDAGVGETFAPYLAGTLYPCITQCTTAPPTPPAITVSGGAAKVCDGDIRTYTIAADPCNTYTWTAPANATILGGQGTTSVVVQFGPGFVANGTLSVVASNTCGTSGTKTLMIYKNTTATPSAIVVTGGLKDVCPGDVRTYTVTNVTGVTYTWSMGTGGTIVGGQGSNSVLVQFTASLPATTGITVTASSPCGTSGPRSAVIKKNTKAPTTPAALTGVWGLCGLSSATVSTNNVTNHTYNWTVDFTPPTIASGNGTNVVNLNLSGWTGSPSPNYIRVTATNGCGLTSAQRKSPLKQVAAASTSLSGTTSVCSFSNHNYTTAAIPAATGYAWKAPIGSTISDGVNSTLIVSGATVFNTTATTVTVTFPNMSTFTTQQSVKVAGTNACGTGPYKVLKVNWGSCKTDETAMEAAGVKMGVNVYPNPARNEVSIQISSDIETNATVLFVNMLGEEVMSSPLEVNTGDNLSKFDISKLPAGTYFVSFVSNEYRTVKELLVVK